MRYFLELSYCGTLFNGWQIQPNSSSVQEEIERALTVYLQSPTSIVGAGRTDTGVHAKYYVAHFDSQSPKLNDPTRFLYHLNGIVSPEIVFHSVQEVSYEAHARFDATEREYKYYLTTKKNPFLKKTAAHIYFPLSLEKMNEAAQIILKYNDFTSFAKLHTDTKTNICKVTVAEWTIENGIYVFTIRANRFLRNMVRAIVGTLINCGKSKISTEEFEDIILSKDRSAAGSSAPAEGLYLTDVVYPYFKRTNH